jgi:hypothetical protein
VRRSGYLCIADSDHQHVREVNTSGTMSTVSGNGTVGYGGARPVVALDGIDVGVMIVGGGFAVDDVIVLRFVQDLRDGPIRRSEPRSTSTHVQ